MILHPKQREIVESKARFKVIRAGRKGGKTSEEVETICYKATVSASKLKLHKTIFPTGRKVLYIAPTQKQARTIIWQSLKNRLQGIGKSNEAQMEMTVPSEDGTKSVIYVGGWENRENYRGLTDVIHITFDEVDTLRNFFLDWLEIFRPMFLDTGGTANFIGTPKKENPNLRRLEKDFQNKGDNFASFKFTSLDNPHLNHEELEEIKKEYENDMESYRQEILAEYVENQGALFKYDSLIDMFSNTVSKGIDKYLVVDIADDGGDKTIFSFWHGLECYRIDVYNLQTDGIINQIRESASQEKIPYSQIVVDAIGVGAGVASSPLLQGIIGYKSSYSALKTDIDPTKLPNVHYRTNAPLTAEYKNLRSQCVFTLAGLVNDHKVACRVQDTKIKEYIIEELSNYQDVSQGDGKRMATQKEDIMVQLGRSPDISDTFLMRMYFELRSKLLPNQSETAIKVREGLQNQFNKNKRAYSSNK